MEKILLTLTNHVYFHGSILQMDQVLMAVQIHMKMKVEIGVQQVWMQMEYMFLEVKNGDFAIHFAQYMLRKVSYIYIY